MSKKRILIVDDELNIRRILQAAFDKHGWYAAIAESGEEALALAKDQQFDCVLTDVTMPGMSGYDLQSHFAKAHPDLPVVIMTAYGTIPQAVAAIRNGAFEFVTKPFDLDALKKVVGAAVDGRGWSASKPSRRSSGNGKSREFIATSEAMKEVAATIRQVADSRATVLITGESGTGKEVAAKLLHEQSPRADRPFVAISCAAIPESLLESELFGHEKGAFTGADSSKPGRFELADGGTLFLDEIGDIPMATQIKLLRVLQEREFERLGSTKPTKVDVRLITATNRNLQDMVDEGTFRLDLLYRLQVVELSLPPLRERGGDVPALALHFLKKYSTENGRKLTSISDEALDVLTQYPWPGNIRELENTIERACVMASNDDVQLEARSLPQKIRAVAA